MMPAERVRGEGVLALPAIAALVRRQGRAGPYLEAHHIVAAERIARLYERSRLTPRVTMRYEPVPGGGRQGRREGGSDIPEMAAEARKALARLHGHLPPDCMDVIVDVVGYEKGLGEIEAARGWPRRSAKMVLRIALDQAAIAFGLSGAATGAASGSVRGWVAPDGRPTLVG
ncbi:DUF6456 domain-containing protein [Pelagibacterium montanilacus]|uniref:DUF6456 domain-containing protein n=1 Tax=Pelagibacterium montanilacus TaxID=2185280 RepID=UPI000F8E6B3B|nr:DUF6456 domain-containing protein [Pelagibacterium montanilacus]